jgi:hypothetical protein
MRRVLGRKIFKSECIKHTCSELKIFLTPKSPIETGFLKGRYSTVVVRVIGNDEVVSSILTSGTIIY